MSLPYQPQYSVTVLYYIYYIIPAKYVNSVMLFCDKFFRKIKKISAELYLRRKRIQDIVLAVLL